MLLQGGIVVGGQLGGQPSVEGSAIRGGAARNRFAGQVPRLPALFEIAFDGRQRHLEHGSHLGAGRALIERTQHVFAEVG